MSRGTLDHLTTLVCLDTMLFAFHFYLDKRIVTIKASVCLWVCLSVRSDVSKTHDKFHEIFCTFYLSAWFGRLLTTMRYIIYFLFCG